MAQTVAPDQTAAAVQVVPAAQAQTVLPAAMVGQVLNGMRRTGLAVVVVAAVVLVVAHLEPVAMVVDMAAAAVVLDIRARPAREETAPKV